MNKQFNPKAITLLSVDQAYLTCQGADLERTKKSIRRWAQNGRVEAKKQTTRNGERWLIDKASLDAVIREELEFQTQQRAAVDQDQTQEKHGADMRVHEQTSPHMSEPVHTRPDASGHRADVSTNDDMKTLNSQIQVLKVDVGWRDKLIERLERENEKGNESLMAQARFIGHLETKLERLGGAPDQKYLEAPIPANHETLSVELETPPAKTHPHPDQQNLYTGRT